jgi:lipooligosaccharide transport system ATP-binding protein
MVESIMSVVRAKGLVKAYGEQRVVDGVDLEVRPGECFGLLGPNGAGKTTILRMLLGSTTPTAGDLQVLGCEIPGQAREMRNRVGVVPQHDNLDPDFTVVENLYSYASFFGISETALQPRLDELLAFANLEHKAEANIQTLSGGMQRRLTLARALVNQPELVVLDEPTTGLDPQARHVIWQRLRSLLNKGTTLILTTHYMEEAQRLCDRIAVIDQGRLLAVDTPQGLIEAHIEPYVLELHGDQAENNLGKLSPGLISRTEYVGETIFCYVTNEHGLMQELQALPGRQYLYRPAGLEDVFLKLTGRDLRDG